MSIVDGNNVCCVSTSHIEGLKQTRFSIMLYCCPDQYQNAEFHLPKWVWVNDWVKYFKYIPFKKVSDNG
jgi:hypothetical protein